jgi:hypothetical protein
VAGDVDGSAAAGVPPFPPTAVAHAAVLSVLWHRLSSQDPGGRGYDVRPLVGDVACYGLLRTPLAAWPTFSGGSPAGGRGGNKRRDEDEGGPPPTPFAVHLPGDGWRQPLVLRRRVDAAHGVADFAVWCSRGARGAVRGGPPSAPSVAAAPAVPSYSLMLSYVTYPSTCASVG